MTFEDLRQEMTWRNLSNEEYDARTKYFSDEQKVILMVDKIERTIGLENGMKDLIESMNVRDRSDQLLYVEIESRIRSKQQWMK